MRFGFEIMGAKSKKDEGQEAPMKAPMAPRGPSRTSPTTDQLRVRRQIARTAASSRLDEIVALIAELSTDALQELWSLASEEQAKTSDRSQQDALATVRGKIMEEFQSRGLEPAMGSKTASGFGSDFEGGGMLHALWIKIRNWIIGHNGYNDSYMDAFASRTAVKIPTVTEDQITKFLGLLEGIGYTIDRDQAHDILLCSGGFKEAMDTASIREDRYNDVRGYADIPPEEGYGLSALVETTDVADAIKFPGYWVNNGEGWSSREEAQSFVDKLRRTTTYGKPWAQRALDEKFAEAPAPRPDPQGPFTHWKANRASEETTMDTSTHREAALLHEMATAPLDRQREIAGELGQITQARTAAFEQDREMDLGGAVIRDTLTPVLTASLHTSATDWMDEDIDAPESGSVQRDMTAAASRWFMQTSAAVKEDVEEYQTQAQGMAHVLAGAHAPLHEVAADAFVRHALFLNRQAATRVTDTDHVYHDCDACDGKGEVGEWPDKKSCSACGGSGADQEKNASTASKTAAQVVYHESYGNVSRAQLAAYRKFNVSPSDHDSLADKYGADNHEAITAAVKKFARDGMFSVFDMWDDDRDDFGFFSTGGTRTASNDMDADLEIALRNYSPCPSYPGQSYNKSTGDCSCGGRHSALDRTAADADINPYPANEQAGYAESGLPVTPPVEGYDAEGVGENGEQDSFAPQVAPENAAAVAEKEGDRTPMPGFGEQVTGAVDAGMRSAMVQWFGPIHHEARRVMAGRSLSEIAREIRQDWANVNFAAAPYLDAMSELNSISDSYGADDAKTIVLYFLNNASAYRGDKAKEIKAELRAMVKSGSVTAATEDDDTYSIIRFNQDGPREVIETGLSLDEAKAHCQDPSTQGDGWFHGFEKEGSKTALRRTAGELEPEDIPSDFEVQPIANPDLSWGRRRNAEGDWEENTIATCGECGLSWDDGVSTSMTPTPSGRCPFEYFHEYGDEDRTASRRTAADEGGSTCATCGDSIARDPEGEANRTWHHTNGTSHDHEASPSGGSKKGSQARIASSPRYAANVQEALGFSSIEALTVEGDNRDLPSMMAKAINAAGASRGIPMTGPSDSLDMSRDIILDEAATSLGFAWEISGDTLRIWPIQYGTSWPIKEGKLHTASGGTQGIAIYPDKRVENVTLSDLKAYQAIVGGYIEPVTLSDGSTLYVNEEYLYQFGPDDFNSIATDVAGLGGRPEFMFRQPILGPAVLVGPVDAEGDDTDVTDAGKRWVQRVAREASKTAGTDPEDQNGQAETALPTPQTQTETMWPWELPEGETTTGEGAADVASVPTPGQSEADYPQPKGASKTANRSFPGCPPKVDGWIDSWDPGDAWGSAHGIAWGMAEALAAKGETADIEHNFGAGGSPTEDDIINDDSGEHSEAQGFLEALNNGSLTVDDLQEAVRALDSYMDQLKAEGRDY